MNFLLSGFTILRFKYGIFSGVFSVNWYAIISVKYLVHLFSFLLVFKIWTQPAKALNDSSISEEFSETACDGLNNLTFLNINQFLLYQ